MHNHPQHIAVVMDGNNRWAKARNLASNSGHRAGADAVKTLIDCCIARDIKFLTLFAFSSENWLRPSKEVQGLMALFMAVLKRKEIQLLHRKDVRIQFIGSRSSFSEKLTQSMTDVEQLTAANTGLTLTVAADYGGRWDITNAAKTIAKDVLAGSLDLEAIDANTVAKHISLSDYPEPDLCIRTGGEQRVSNFLLWQFAYTELYFSQCLWPDFNEAEFQLALDNFASRQRRFGSHDEDENGADNQLARDAVTCQESVAQAPQNTPNTDEPGAKNA